MTLTIDAVYDGKVFLPSEPISLRPNTHVRIFVVAEGEGSVSFFDVAQSLDLNGPPDWSSKLDEYLYGGRTTS
jgi:predicted DNA-binding antitoxin AbrB/MazE fold protein